MTLLRSRVLGVSVDRNIYTEDPLIPLTLIDRDFVSHTKTLYLGVFTKSQTEIYTPCMGC